MNKKLSVLRRITAVVLCVTLLSSQVVVANAEDSERMNVQTNSEITDISEQDSFSSDTSETSDITESDIPDSFEGESEPNTDISSEVTEKFDNSEDQGFTDEEETIGRSKSRLCRWKNMYLQLSATSADRYRNTDVFRRQRRKSW